MLLLRCSSSEVLYDAWKPQHKVIQGHGARPPFFCRLLSLVEMGVMANKAIHFIRIQDAIVIFLL
jgi:hypothetical protein